MNLATFLAACKSGAFGRPIANECKRDQPDVCRWPWSSIPASCFSSTLLSSLASALAFSVSRAAIAAIKEESSPPDRRTPYGTSAISLFLTAFSKLCLIAW
uniref:G6359 protein n=1 Tax=Saccharomyces cerevisiae TaxID=4932 RepID=A2NXV8_YEASX|nr:G6359 [Saccharomyces cerevisiae]